LEEALVVAREPDHDLVALDEPLMTLAAVAREAVRYGKAIFGGLTIDGTAAALQVSRDTVKRDWNMAKLWLLRELRGGTQNVI
jgi:ECF sigma factor